MENSELNTLQMEPFHSWEVNVEEAIQIQENLRNRIILEKTFTEVRTIGGGDVAYSRDRNFLFAAIAVLSFPKMETLDIATAHGEISFPYIPGLLSFREGPILIKAFQKLKMPSKLQKISVMPFSHVCPKMLGPKQDSYKKISDP